MAEQYSANINPLSELIEGLSEVDAIAALDDITLFGSAFVHEVDGVKRRFPPHQWRLFVEPDRKAED